MRTAARTTRGRGTRPASHMRIYLASHASGVAGLYTKVKSFHYVPTGDTQRIRITVRKRRARATRVPPSRTGHSTAPTRGSGSTRTRGRPTSSPAASSPQQRLSTETAALSPSTQYSPGSGKG